MNYICKKIILYTFFLNLSIQVFKFLIKIKYKLKYTIVKTRVVNRND